MIQAPEVDFYGDATPWPSMEFVHSERLVERSEVHDWTIRPHRHNNLVQIFLVLEGHGRARLDARWHEVGSLTLLLVPARVVHEFAWSRASDGYVLSIRSDFATTLAQQVEALGAVFGRPAVLDISASRDFITALFAEIHAESGGRRAHKEIALDSLLRTLGIWLVRNTEDKPPSQAAGGRAAQHFLRFTRLVDERHKVQWTLAEYAAALGITPSHLNTICRKLAGKTALDLVHQRQVLAARRELTYTERNIAGIAHHLGFADPSYFTRFFKRETGMTPGEYRRRSGTFDDSHLRPPDAG